MVYLALMRSVFLGSSEVGFRRVWIDGRHNRFHVASPCAQLGLKFGGDLGLLAGEIIFFSDVVAQAEQLQLSVLVPFDQLPIAVANRAVRRAALIAVMRVVPEERTTREFPALQQRLQTQPVLWRELGGLPGQFENRRVEIRG